MKNNRLFGIIYLLLSHEAMTSKSLAEYFEVSPRTIYRDIDSLSSLGIPIYMSKGKNGGVSLLSNYKLDKTLLTAKEQREILFSLESLNKLQVTNNETYNKLKSLFSSNDENWFEIDFSTWSNSAIHQKNFEIIKNAIINKNILEFTYFNSSGTTTNRIVEPLKLYFQHNSWYLYAFDQTKNDYRFFKLMRIKDLTLLSQTFTRTNIGPKKEFSSPPKVIKLIIEIDESQSYRVYDEFLDFEVTKLPNGNFKVSTQFPYNNWLYGYLLSFGPHLKVLEPLFIQTKIKELLQKSLNKYL